MGSLYGPALNYSAVTFLVHQYVYKMFNVSISLYSSLFSLLFFLSPSFPTDLSFLFFVSFFIVCLFVLNHTQQFDIYILIISASLSLVFPAPFKHGASTATNYCLQVHQQFSCDRKTVHSSLTKIVQNF